MIKQKYMKVKVSYAGLALIFFYAYDFFYMVIQKCAHSSFIAKISTLFILYTILAITYAKSSKRISVNGIMIIIFCTIMFILSYFIHPEYENAMLYAPAWNIWKSVFTFSSGIFACIFFDIFDDPYILRRYLKYAGYILLFWCILRINTALTRGGFQRSMQNGVTSSNIYDMAVGYRLLFVSIIFSIEFEKEKNKIRFLYIVISILSFIAMIIYGSRTASASFVVFWILRGIFYQNNIKLKKYIIKITFLLISIFIMYQILTNEMILQYLHDILSSLGVSSRILDTLVSGSVTLDKGRDRVWSEAWLMILENPVMGKGIYADRYYFGIYCHQFIIEVFLNFGIIIGSIVILFLIWKSIQILFRCKNNEWKLLFILFLSMIIVRLNMSSSFWSDTNFWACLIIGSKALKATPKVDIKIT